MFDRFLVLLRVVFGGKDVCAAGVHLLWIASCAKVRMQAARE